MKHFGEDDRGRMWLRVRMGLIVAFFSLGFVAVVGRVYYLQTVEAEMLLSRQASQLNQHVTRKARRGNIVDRNGVELAVSVEVPSIFARPGLIENPEREARRLAPHLRMDYERLVGRLSSESPFVWLERQTRPPSAEAIAALDIPGIGITNEYKRYYPMSERAGQIVGFVNIDGEGLEGIERALERELAGGTYEMSITRDARGRPMLTADAPRFRDFEGYSVRLTIDEKIQRVAEQALADQVEAFNASGGYAVVIDVHTGEILAMANTPAFDPNRLNDFESSAWRLRNITDTFEPGSIFKPFTIAAALEERAIRLDTNFDCENGRMQIGRHTIKDVKRAGILNVGQIMQVSSNIGSYKIAQTIGREKFYEYLRGFGFGQRTGLGLRGEQPGMLWPADRWPEIAFANVSFGQGLTTTPLQLAVSTAAIANGGLMLQPRIIDSIVDRDGNVVRKTEPTLIRRVISPEVAREVAWAMSLVTIQGGTGTRAALEDFTVAGKTGTAQKVNSETRRYDPNLWMAGFVGFVPAERPDIAIAIIIDEPRKMHYGGVVAGPVFRVIAKETLAIRGIMPLPEEERFDLTRPASFRAPVAAKEDKRPVVMLPTMRILDDPFEMHEDDIDDDEEIELGQRLPDFRELTLRQAMRRAEALGLSPSIEGWGRVIAQSPAPGTLLEEGLELGLVLSPATGQSLIADEPSTGPMQ
jgi:cell division protein FtsI (penicillin-binding protein 3)